MEFIRKYTNLPFIKYLKEIFTIKGEKILQEKKIVQIQCEVKQKFIFLMREIFHIFMMNY